MKGFKLRTPAKQFGSILGDKERGGGRRGKQWGSGRGRMGEAENGQKGGTIIG